MEYRCSNCVRVSRSVSKAVATDILEKEDLDILQQNKNLKEECKSLKHEVELLKIKSLKDADSSKDHVKEIQRLQKEVQACENLLRNNDETKQELEKTVLNPI